MKDICYQGEAALAPMTPKEAAIYTGWSVETLAKWRRQGKGPSYSKQHKRIYYFKDRLDSYLALLRAKGV